MFSGIIQQIGQITSLSPFQVKIVPDRPFIIGGSIAIDGVCLTVVSIDGPYVIFHLSQETLKKTALGSYQINDFVNIERALVYGDEVGGHLLSGHVAGCVKLEAQSGEMWQFSIPDFLKPYIFYKGYIALNGISLTVAELSNESFCVALIPETLNRTTLKEKQVGDLLNVEWDQLTYSAVETIRRLHLR
jgi:riboflavin synthase